MRHRLDEADGEAPRKIAGQESMKQVSLRMRSPQPPGQERGQDDEEERLVQLRWVAGCSIAEVNAPGQIRGDAVRPVPQAAEETTQAANGDSDGQGNGVQIPGRARNAPRFPSR